MTRKLRVVIIKPSKYGFDGYVERFRWGFMPNSSIPYLRSMTPDQISDTPVEIHVIDEYVHTDLNYLSLLKKETGYITLLALVGVQSHQFQRALDLAAYAHKNGCLAVIGGPHPMTCDTSLLHNSGISFALAEADLVWLSILQDAISGELQPVYGNQQRWRDELNSPVIIPPEKKDLKRYIFPMLGLYPARGCPFLCNYCSVIKIAGRKIRSQNVETTMESLKAARAAGVKMIMFTSDNFNKYPEAGQLLEAIIEARLDLKFFVQCDTQVSRQENLISLLSKAGCFQMFVGVESFNRQTLLAARKGQNRPDCYQEIVSLCNKYGISSHFSNIIGFPQDTETEIEFHLETLCRMNPTWASFYLLCPIPGTEQYHEFRSKGIISETNLDRFDTTCLTWNHPLLDKAKLEKLLFHCYRKFYSTNRGITNIRQSHLKRVKFLGESLAVFAYLTFNRYSAWKNTHPMSGGIKRLLRDKVSDFIALRREVFGFEMLPLPENIKLEVQSGTEHQPTEGMIAG